MLEYCYLLPNYADFEEARQLMEGLATLCPGLLQNTLRACRSLKAKRLFLALADIVGHEWYGAIGDNTLADAILDRIVHNSHRLELGGESMRKIEAEKTEKQAPEKEKTGGN